MREFCIVIGKGKRAIEDHFTQDYSYTAYLRNRQLSTTATDLDAFYQRLDDSIISWVTQPEPRGFGDAALRARRALENASFLVHAGDAYIISKGHTCVERLAKTFDEMHPSAMLLIHETVNLRQKGVAEVRPIDPDSFEVLSVVEKPEKPKTNLSIEPVYIFQHYLFQALETIKPDKSGEIQVTAAIQQMISEGKKVYAAKLLKDEMRLDVGDAESYWETLSASYRLAKG